MSDKFKYDHACNVLGCDEAEQRACETKKFCTVIDQMEFDWDKLAKAAGEVNEG